MFNIERFIEAQDKVYSNVVNELKNGKKKTHWMWYIFPQHVALGFSDISLKYGIKSIDEVKCYISNPILKERYIECCNILFTLESNDSESIFGEIDSMKLKSSLTLFKFVDKENESLYNKLLKKFYNGEECNLTLQLLNR